MPTFVKIPMVHPNNIEGDSTIYMNVESVDEIVVASPMDKRQRTEVKTIVMSKTGKGVATTLSAVEVIDAIKNAERGCE